MSCSKRGKCTEKKTEEKKETVSYRAKCNKSGAGLSHYVVYGEEKNS
ncbi:MAG: hypothetical protein PHR44_05700 [Candidatus Omnitrophica bacterium]|nr:hypothetical protein [Candidatus Omnitrophota bacterium]